MKAILLPIKPKHVAKILNMEKTIEIRKTMPKCEELKPLTKAPQSWQFIEGVDK